MWWWRLPAYGARQWALAPKLAPTPSLRSQLFQGARPAQVSAAATSLNKLWWRGKPTGAASENGGAAAYAPGPSATAPSPGAAGIGRSEAPLPV